MSTLPVPTEDLRPKAKKAFGALTTAFNNVDNIRLDYWKMGNALGTMIDYCYTIPAPWSPVDTIVQNKMKTFAGKIDGLWFDDYLWWAAAALQTPTLGGKELYPAWAAAFKLVWAKALPGTTVAKDRIQKYPALQIYRPLYEGGIWNAEWTEKGPWWEWDQKDREFKANCLYGIQNSVTNALRLIAAAHGTYFFPDLCRTAAQFEFAFLKNWFEAKEADSLLYQFTNSQGEKCALMRERVRAFADPNVRDKTCDYNFYWAGDQGLLLRGLLVYMKYVDPSSTPYCLDLARKIIYGVADQFIDPAKDTLLPYIGNGVPQGDTADYDSGVGVFMRHLRYAWLTQPLLKDAIKKTGLDGVAQEMAAKLPDDFQPSEGLNDLTNSVATLVVALSMQAAPVPVAA